MVINKLVFIKKYLFFALVIALQSFSSRAEVIDIPHADGVATRTFLLSPTQPKALVLLYPGGGGMLRLDESGYTPSRHTFVRSKDLWIQHNIAAVLVDTPYDLGDLRRGDIRGFSDHLQRTQEVIEYFSDRYDVPIWIFGHSMGTSTVFNLLNKRAEIQSKLHGAIIAGTVRSAFIEDKVKLPLIAIHHNLDSCLGSLPENSKNIINKRSPNLTSKLLLIDGGISIGSECESLSYHGFNQTEQLLIEGAVQFILEN